MPTNTPDLAAQYRRDGYVVVRQLIAPATVREMVDHFMDMNAKRAAPSVMGGDKQNPNDPLNKFPRPINMHPWDKKSEAWSRIPAVLDVVKRLIGDEPVLNQTMLYYKPPGARGQAFHQDQQYITIEPLIGVWFALDDADRANGQMTVFPGSHKLGLLPVEKADISVSFTDGTTKLPRGINPIGLDMKAGDVLFFDGKTVHGSHPNVTEDRFRRSFICHYVGAHAKKFEPPRGTHMTHLAGGVAELPATP
jgi:phytanoyl-CoA hydroxylase